MMHGREEGFTKKLGQLKPLVYAGLGVAGTLFVQYVKDLQRGEPQPTFAYVGMVPPGYSSDSSVVHLLDVCYPNGIIRRMVLHDQPGDGYMVPGLTTARQDSMFDEGSMIIDSVNALIPSYRKLIREADIGLSNGLFTGRLLSEMAVGYATTNGVLLGLPGFEPRIVSRLPHFEEPKLRPPPDTARRAQRPGRRRR